MTVAGSRVRFNQFSRGASAATSASFAGSVSIGYLPDAAGPTPLISTFDPGSIATWTIAEQLAVGDSSADATLEINGGSTFTSTAGRIGAGALGVNSKGHVNITGSGSSWTIGGMTGALDAQNGSLNVYNLGLLQTGSATLGHSLGQMQATVDQASWYVSGSLEVGPASLTGPGWGRLNVQNGGQVFVTGSVNVHGTSSAVSRVTVETGGSIEADGDFLVRDYGNVVYGAGSSAASKTFQNFGSTVPGGAAGATELTGDANAADANFNNFASTVASAFGGQTTFSGAASAGQAVITNSGPTLLNGYGGRTYFRGASSATNAMIINQAAYTSPSTGVVVASTEFYDTATAGAAIIINKSGNGFRGITTFHGSSTAGEGVFINESSGPTGFGGTFSFRGSSSAGSGVFTNGPLGGDVLFTDSATAGQAQINLRGKTNSLVQFGANSNAGNALLDVGPGSFSQLNEVSRAQFLGSSSAAQATITVRGGGGSVSFTGIGGPSAPAPTTTAGSAFIEVFGATSTQNSAGTALFSSASTAGSATITAHGSNVPGIAGGGAVVTFANGGRAGASTITANGGATPAAGAVIRFQQGGVGDSARLIINSGASADFSLNLASGTSVGSIEGAGRFSLGGSLLTVGNLGASTAVNGSISDSGGLNHNTGGRLTKVGAGTLTLGGVNTYSGLTTINAGVIALTGSLTGGVVVNAGGTLQGTGSVGGQVTVQPGGVLAPGLSPGTLTVGGLNLMSGSELRYELGAERDHIVLTGSGAVTLGGTLTVSLLEGFVPTLGASIPLFEGVVGSIAGMFDEVFVPTFNGMTFIVSQTASSVSLQVGQAPPLPGDYNGDGTVDAADYTRWRDNLGNASSLFNDDTPGVGPDDYDRWKANYGMTAQAAMNAQITAPAVPEPQTVFLSFVSLLILGWIGRRGVGGGATRLAVTPSVYLRNGWTSRSHPLGSRRIRC